MEEFINNIILLLLPMNDVFLYIFLFISAIIENLFPPIPGDTITVFGAFLVGIGRLDYIWVYLSTTSGSVIGFIILFFLGKYLGRKFFHEKNYKHFSIEKIEKTEKWLKIYGYWIILANRFMPGVRSVISIVSGISELNNFKVIIFSFISASIWNLIWIHTGFLLGSNWKAVKEKFSIIMMEYNIVAAIIIIVFIIILIIIRRYKRKKNIDKNDILS